jgi:LmbE family N-acetylglucosaminyl deacetylase
MQIPTRNQLVLFLLAATPAVSASITGTQTMHVDVLFVGAHPDDDAGVVATLARYGLDEGFRTGVLTVTGGEGGGNAIGRETGRALGLIRRAEELNALSFAGVDATDFLGLQDFYFTLSAEETARRWGSSFVCDVARIVRLRRPAVIVTMWPGPGTHGQHQMAARAATLAFARGGDPGFCPEQSVREGVEPYAADKLYYVGARDVGDTARLDVPTADFSPSARLRYADLKALSISQYRSQGYDRFAAFPVAQPSPESFLLVRSRVPITSPEQHMLAGSRSRAGTSLAGVRFSVSGQYRAPIGIDTEIELTLESAVALDEIRLKLSAPAGWNVARADDEAGVSNPGDAIVARFWVRPGPDAIPDRNVTLLGSYSARSAAGHVTGENRIVLRPVAALSVSFRPRFDVAGYRTFAKESDTEWVIETLPARVPLVIDQTREVAFDVRNDGDAPASGSLELRLPAGLRLAAPVDYSVGAGSTLQVSAWIEATRESLPRERSAGRVPVEVRIPGGGSDQAEAFVLPHVAIPRLSTPPTIDADLAELRSAGAAVEIGPSDRWWRAPPTDAADLSAGAWLGYDDANLYVGLRVRDDTVVCNIAPDDVRAQLRSDAIGITIDPSGSSADTSTTMQIAAFPCTSEGWGARAFRDADAHQGIAEETAPRLRVVSRRTADGFDIEWALPWAAMPEQPTAGAEIGLNLVLYDGDQQDAAVGANISETGLAWAAFEWGGKQALPYLWGRARLAD